MSRTIKYFFILFTTSAIVVAGSLNYSGFCASQGRWLPDEEFLLNAIANNAERINTDVIKDSIKNFIKENPRCCILQKGDLGMSSNGIIETFLTKIFGIAYASADIQFPLVKSQITSVRPNDYYVAYPTFNTCGKVISQFGMDIKKSETRFK